jgi:hypothetical protein
VANLEVTKFDESPLPMAGFSFFGTALGQHAIIASAVFTLTFGRPSPCCVRCRRLLQEFAMSDTALHRDQKLLKLFSV